MILVHMSIKDGGCLPGWCSTVLMVVPIGKEELLIT